MYNVILNVCRNCWKTLWMHSPNTFVNDIPQKRTRYHYSGMVFKAFNFCVGKILCITCACGLWKYLICVIINLHGIYLAYIFKPYPLLRWRVSLFNGVLFMLKCFVILLVSVIYVEHSLLVKESFSFLYVKSFLFQNLLTLLCKCHKKI